MRIKSRLLFIFLFVFYAMSLPFATAETFIVPQTITEIEPEAFGGSASFSSVFIPETVQTIAPDAFSDAVVKVYGIAGSAAESFSKETGRTFVSIGVEISSVTYPEWTAPDRLVTLTVKAKTSFGPIKYRYSVTNGENTYYFSSFSSRSTMEGTIPKGGVYDLVIEAKNEYYTTVHVIKNAITVGEHVLFMSDVITLGTDRLTEALSHEETREVTLSSSNERVFTIEGTSIKGVRPGSAYLKATAIQPEGKVVSTIPVNIYQAASSVIFENAPSELFKGKTVSISATLVPDDAIAEEFSWRSENPQIASITPDGVITAHRQGETNIIAQVDGMDFAHPLRVTVPVETVHAALPEDKPVYTKGKVQILTSALPTNADNQTFAYTSMNPEIASVDENGVITGVQPGQARILLTAKDGAGANCALDVVVIRGVDGVSVSADKTHVYPTQTMETEFSVYPEHASGKNLTWTSSDTNVATVDKNGVVTAHNPGHAVITAEAENGVGASLNFFVYSFETQAGLIVSQSQLYLNPNETHQLTYTTYPDGTEIPAAWSSSNPSIAAVSGDGEVTGISPGTAWIRIASDENPEMNALCKVTVLNPQKTLLMPKRKTVISEIKENLKRIDAVKASAFSELDALYRSGSISKTVLDARKKVIANAFGMYAFPWMTLEHQIYWNVDNSDGGVKDFQPGIVYYGLPYISGSYVKQRLYTPEKAVSENRYYLSDDGAYYILNQDNLLMNKYCGNDCSALTAISYFGFPADIDDWKTSLFATTPKFKTLPDFSDMYPGDIIVRGYNHVVIFLYYANPDKSQVVVIEQGGTEFGINTVSTGIYDVDHYAQDGYIARRFADWF